jgi:hypothetical protein
MRSNLCGRDDLELYEYITLFLMIFVSPLVINVRDYFLYPNSSEIFANHGVLVDKKNKCSSGKTSSIGLSSPSLVILERKSTTTFFSQFFKDG